MEEVYAIGSSYVTKDVTLTGSCPEKTLHGFMADHRRNRIQTVDQLDIRHKRRAVPIAAPLFERRTDQIVQKRAGRKSSDERAVHIQARTLGQMTAEESRIRSQTAFSSRISSFLTSVRVSFGTRPHGKNCRH